MIKHSSRLLIEPGEDSVHHFITFFLNIVHIQYFAVLLIKICTSCSIGLKSTLKSLHSELQRSLLRKAVKLFRLNVSYLSSCRQPNLCSLINNKKIVSIRKNRLLLSMRDTARIRGCFRVRATLLRAAEKWKKSFVNFIEEGKCRFVLKDKSKFRSSKLSFGQQRFNGPR